MMCTAVIFFSLQITTCLTTTMTTRTTTTTIYCRRISTKIQRQFIVMQSTLVHASEINSEASHLSDALYLCMRSQRLSSPPVHRSLTSVASGADVDTASTSSTDSGWDEAAAAGSSSILAPKPLRKLLDDKLKRVSYRLDVKQFMVIKFTCIM